MTNKDACPSCGGNLFRWDDLLRCTCHSRHVFTTAGQPTTVEAVAA